jgi:large conductance mechanosensitive channel
MKLFNNLRKTLSRFSIIDLVVSVIAGVLVSRVLASLLYDILFPLLGNGGQFRDLKYTLMEASCCQSANSINYGLFIQTILDFLIIVLCIAVSIIIYGSIFKKKEEPKPEIPQPLPEPELTEHDLLHYEIVELLKEIRDNTKTK